MNRGDIYLVSLEPTQGHEEQGTRPVLIVWPDPFNAMTRVPIAVSITSDGAFARNSGFAVSLADAGTRTTGFARCDHPRPLDLLARKGRKLESVPGFIMDDVLAKLATILT